METFRRFVRQLANLPTRWISSSSSGCVQSQLESVQGAGTSGTSWTTAVKSAGQEDAPPIYRVVTVGGGGVGKSSLIVQFMYDEVRS